MNNFFEEQLDLKKEVLIYLSYWKYFVISAAIAFFAAYFYLRYTNPIYSIESKIKILSENNQGLKLPSELLGMMVNKSGINLENEIETLKSRRLLGAVVSNLNLTTSYSTIGKLRTTALWNPPFTVVALVDKNKAFAGINFFITAQKEGYLIKPLQKNPFFVKGKSITIKINDIEVRIEPNDKGDIKFLGQAINVTIIPFDAAVGSVMGQIAVSQVGKESEILSIKAVNENTYRGIAIVNNFVEVYNNDGINDRRVVNKKTVDFIDERFKSLAFELDSIENQKRDFKKSNDISFIEADASVDVNKKAFSDVALFRLETQIQLSKLLRDALKSGKTAILPANIGLDNVIISGLINEYNTLVLQRERLLNTAGNENPVLNSLNDQINIVKSNITESIATYSKQLSVSLSQQQTDFSRAAGQVMEIPANEKTLRSIERQQKIKENLYLLLLQKREESSIAYAVTAPSIKIIDYATASPGPIAPKRNIIFLVALFLGLAIPFGIIFLYNLLDTKIKDTAEVAFRKSQIPVIAEIPFFEEFKLFKDKNDRSVHAESFRILSSNVSFSLPLKESEVGQVILVTSSIMSEGKTFIATNLSLAFASYNKRVLLVGADMRKPKLHLSLEMDKVDKGLSIYLHDKNTSWQDVVVKNNPYNQNLDVIFSGIIPPNPSNIISNGRFEEFINQAKLVYDYIIVDTAPTIYVNDTFLIAPTADLTLYLTRQDYTEKQLIDYAATLKESEKLKNMAFIFNGIKAKGGYGYGYNYKYSYNYGYGYGYGEDDTKDKNRRVTKRLLSFFTTNFKK